MLDMNKVKPIHKSVGMGLVCRVHHQGLHQTWAVKSPRAEYFSTEAYKKNFVKECLAWIGLAQERLATEELKRLVPPLVKLAFRKTGRNRMKAGRNEFLS
jgi:hypothetical protein